MRREKGSLIKFIYESDEIHQKSIEAAKTGAEIEIGEGMATSATGQQIRSLRVKITHPSGKVEHLETTQQFTVSKIYP